MPFDPNNTPHLTFGDQKNTYDWGLAFEGQWFIGVLDTHNKRVYFLPITPRSPEALSNNGARNRNRYASGPEAKGFPPTTFWNSAPANWETNVGGNTTHHRCLNHYGLLEEDCLGFSIIKLDREGKFAQIKLTSNSLNSKAGYAERDPTAVPGHSFGRSTASHAGTLGVDAAGRPNPDTHVSGSTTFCPGTVCMGQSWANDLKAFFGNNGIPNIALSLD